MDFLPPRLRFLLLLLVAACGGEEEGTEPTPAPEATEHLLAAPLAPTPGPTFASTLKGYELAEEALCEACHQSIFAQHQLGAHSFASMSNPIYRASVERLREDRGKKSSLVCAACHDPALLVDGAMMKDILPKDPRASVGVGCKVCHGITGTQRSGNGSYQLTRGAFALPHNGDPETVRAHREGVATSLAAELCASCHQSFLSPASGNAEYIAGQNEFLHWANSAYTKQGASREDKVAPKTCIDCHMPRILATEGDAASDSNNTVRSHRFLGGHSWLSQAASSDRLNAQGEFLKRVVSIDAIANESGDSAVDLYVVLRNTGVGHRFPGGVRDASEIWVEVVVRDSQGKAILRSSGQHAHRLRALVADASGTLLAARQTHQFSVLIADHTISARDAVAIRYRGTLPKGTKAAFFEARLLHKTRSSETAKLACEESQLSRSENYPPVRFDACSAQPITEIASTRTVSNDKGAGDFDRQYNLGLALLHETRDRLQEAEAPLRRSLAIALSEENVSNQQKAKHGLATMEARLGRVDSALALTEDNPDLGSAANWAIRGDALGTVWRWDDAAAQYAIACAKASGNSNLWQKYAIALSSAGHARRALAASTAGLKLDPVNPDLLRIQALAYKAISHPQAKAAMQTYLQYRGTDNRTSVKLKCAAKSATCARELLPVHTHLLEPVSR